MDTIAGIAFGIALVLAGLSETVGLAMIIGAYVTGLSLSQTDIAHEIRENLSGLYSFFVPIFFCVMGMMGRFFRPGSHSRIRSDLFPGCHCRKTDRMRCSQSLNRL